MKNPFKKYNHFPQRKFTGNWTKTLIGTNAKEHFGDGHWESIGLKIEFDKKVYIPGEITNIKIEIDRS
jgi:hypothetical protein